MATVSGGNKFEDALKALGKKLASASEVRVGFPAKAKYPDGTSVASVAAINNFGAPAAGIPARPFFTNMIADKSSTWGPRLARALQASDFNSRRALSGLGVVIAGQLAQSIVEFTAVPNSPVTDLLKQRFPTGKGVTFGEVQRARRDVDNGKTAPPGKPLVWSGRLLNSIDYDVT